MEILWDAPAILDTNGMNIDAGSRRTSTRSKRSPPSATSRSCRPNSPKSPTTARPPKRPSKTSNRKSKKSCRTRRSARASSTTTRSATPNTSRKPKRKTSGSSPNPDPAPLHPRMTISPTTPGPAAMSADPAATASIDPTPQVDGRGWLGSLNSAFGGSGARWLLVPPILFLCLMLLVPLVYLFVLALEHGGRRQDRLRRSLRRPLLLAVDVADLRARRHRHRLHRHLRHALRGRDRGVAEMAGDRPPHRPLHDLLDLAAGPHLRLAAARPAAGRDLLVPPHASGCGTSRWKSSRPTPRPTRRWST